MCAALPGQPRCLIVLLSLLTSGHDLTWFRPLICVLACLKPTRPILSSLMQSAWIQGAGVEWPLAANTHQPRPVHLPVLQS